MSRSGLFSSIVFGVVLCAVVAVAKEYEDLTRCPPGMANIEGRYCVDVYEFPNRKGGYAENGLTWERADFLCRQAGKRLCSRSEWKQACAGPEKLRYPYGNDYQKGICSDPYTPEGRGHYKSGDLEMCSNGYGLFDMSGNLAEWTSDAWENGAFAAIQGGDAYSEDRYALSCEASFKQGTASADPYNGARCCADLLGTPVRRSEVKGTAVRGAASAQVHIPSTRNRKTFSQNVEYIDADDILGAAPLGSYISASGFNLTTGYQFSGGRVDYTRMEYKVDSVNLGTADDTKVGFNVLHANMLLPLAVDFWGWHGDVYLGARRMDSSAGSLTELYALKEYIEGFWSVIPSAGYVKSSLSGREIGFALDVRYHINRNVDLLARYNSEDFYKTLLNDFLAPYTNNAKLLRCRNCREDATTAGLDYVLSNGKSRMYMMWYDIGDMDVPVAGASIDF